MNIFVLDRNPTIAAQQMCDKHVVKMIVESAQMLSTCHRMADGELETRPSVSGKRMVPYYRLDDWRESKLYKAVHFKHPCNIWLRESVNNYQWLFKHFGALLREYRLRYDKNHKCEDLYDALVWVPQNIPFIPQTEFAQAMPDEYKQKDVVLAYRSYYNKFKSDIAKWKSGYIPEWFDGVAA